jgi:cephalosporin hydroxylase
MKQAESSRIARTAVSLGAAQVEDELRQAIDLAGSTRPSVIVEIGCYKGGTLYAWRQVCERVYGISLLEDRKYDGGEPQGTESHGAVVLNGDSHDLLSREWLLSELDGSPVDVLVIDADHRFEAVKRDIVAYAPLVRPGGLILMHDVLLRHPGFPDEEFQVWRMWEQLRPHCDSSVVGTQVGWGVIRVRQGDDIASLALDMTYEDQDRMAV